ncbi:MAG TPA: molybdopterin-dependent oxidoreductase, partial [Deinococcales bacterium]|nr:molybdopterin-dependent oxidoreductase [Deinococcales bacterium]
RWLRATWAEALDEIAGRLKQVIESDGPQAILPYHYAGTMGLLEGAHVHAIWRALGAIELDETICSTAGAAGWEAVYGSPRFGTNPEDVPEARLIFLWGINSLTTNTHLTPFLTAARKNGARIVHLDVYENRTSRFADEFVRLRPGTDAALALAMANVLFQCGLTDPASLDLARGVEDYRAAAAEWPLDRAAAATGVDAGTIERLAVEYGTTRPTFIRVGYGMTRHAGGASALQAVVTLPVLTGQWGLKGGGALLTTSGAFTLNRSRLGGARLMRPDRRVVNMNQLASALEPEAGVKAMVVYNSNPAVVAPDSTRVLAGMRRDDLLVVSLEQAMTETARNADWVLPATTFLEHDDLYTAYGHYHLSYNRAVLPPEGEARPNSWVFARLAERLGLTDESLYWDAGTLTRELLDTGAPNLKGLTLERLQADGFVRLNLPDTFLPYERGSAQTPEGKFRLSPAPRQVEPSPLSDAFPMRLVTPPAHHFLNSTYGPVAALQAAEGGEPVALVHPEDAARLGLKDGDHARLTSAQGSTVRRVRVSAAPGTGTVVVEGTWWNEASPDGLGINALTSEALTDMGGGSTFHDTPIRLERVAEPATGVPARETVGTA